MLIRVSRWKTSCVSTNRLTATLRFIFDNSLPPGLPVPQAPLLAYFPTFVEDLPVAERVEAQERWNRALHFDVVAVLRAALGGDHYWTEQVILMPHRTLAFLRQALNERFTDVVWMDAADRGIVTLSGVVDRADATRIAPLANTYHRVGQALLDRMFFWLSPV